MIVGCEVAIENTLIDTYDSRFRIRSSTSDFDGLIIQVGGENLYVAFIELIV